MIWVVLLVGTAGERANDRGPKYTREILPVLEDYCFQCHGESAEKGGIIFNSSASTEEVLNQGDILRLLLKNIRSGIILPPRREGIPNEKADELEKWIKRDALKLDFVNPDPGRVTLCRLNRVEYRNTIRDLVGIDFRKGEEFPAEDTGHGFDVLGDVPGTSPILLEKCMKAAEFIAARAVQSPPNHKIIP